jgi:hypothetical protein
MTNRKLSPEEINQLKTEFNTAYTKAENILGKAIEVWSDLVGMTFGVFKLSFDAASKKSLDHKSLLDSETKWIEDLLTGVSSEMPAFTDNTSFFDVPVEIIAPMYKKMVRGMDTDLLITEEYSAKVRALVLYRDYLKGMRIGLSYEHTITQAVLQESISIAQVEDKPEAAPAPLVRKQRSQKQDKTFEECFKNKDHAAKIVQALITHGVIDSNEIWKADKNEISALITALKELENPKTKATYLTTTNRSELGRAIHKRFQYPGSDENYKYKCQGDTIKEYTNRIISPSYML